jgi:hypothetical protein
LRTVRPFASIASFADILCLVAIHRHAVAAAAAAAAPHPPTLPFVSIAVASSSSAAAVLLAIYMPSPWPQRRLTSPHSWLRHLGQVVVKVVSNAWQEGLHVPAAAAAAAAAATAAAAAAAVSSEKTGMKMCQGRQIFLMECKLVSAVAEYALPSQRVTQGTG